MPGIEGVAISLGSALIKYACKLWFGGFGGAAGSEITDLLKERAIGEIDQRKALRFFEKCGDIVSVRILRLLDQHEWRALPPNERSAAAVCVHDTFVAAELNTEALLRADLDPFALESAVRAATDDVRRRAALSTNAVELYDFILRESCAYLTQVFVTYPSFRSDGLVEILRRETVLLGRLEQLLDSLPSRREGEGFLTDYCRQVAISLDRMEIFGVRSSESSRNYPLTTAYLSLTASVQAFLPSAPSGRVEEVVAPVRRMVVFGEAGSGKTTLLRWLAVHAAREDLPKAFAEWSGVVPFLVVLRRFVGRPMPRPEQFIDSVAGMIAGEMPKSWVQDRLRVGKAVVLIDGVDELPEVERHGARDWIRQLVNTFPRARYIVTSRPSAIPADWLASMHFRTAEMQPMSALDVQQFVEHWHEAVAGEIGDPAEREALTHCRDSIRKALSDDRHLRRLAVTPLLCALLCALNREMRTQLPRSRMAVYEAALVMLLDQRDRERGVHSVLKHDFTRDDKIVLLQNLALWLVRNGKSQASNVEAERQLGDAMATLPQLDAPIPVDRLRQYLIERSGVLRELSAESIDFVHRTFQEYLAGKAAIEGEFVGELIRNAGDDQWREVIVMAAGHAHPRQNYQLLAGLIHEGAAPHIVIALACLQTAKQVDPDQRAEIQRLARSLMPPRSMVEAEALASVGEFILDVIPEPSTQAEADAVCYVAMRLGGDKGLEIITRLSRRMPRPSMTILLQAWEYFPPDVYARTIMANVEIGPGMIEVRREVLSALRHLPNVPGIAVECTYWGAEILDKMPPMPNILELGIKAQQSDRPIPVALGRSAAMPPGARGTNALRRANPVPRRPEARPRGLWSPLKRLTSYSRRSFPNLTHLSLDSFGFSDLHQLSQLDNVVDLMIVNCDNLLSLDGIEVLPGLASLYIANCGEHMIDLSAATRLFDLTDFMIDCAEVDLSPWQDGYRSAPTVHVRVDAVVKGLADVERIRVVYF